MTVLILGGTAEARELARHLSRQSTPVVSSLAGRVARPALPDGDVRIGGFGGPDGLVAFLEARGITAMVDATHPFAAQMSRNAAVAASRSSIPLLRLARPGWQHHPRSSRWSWVPDLHAARATAEAAARPFLTTGRQSLPTFAAWQDRSVMVRVVDRPDHPLPARWRVILSRGPYAYHDERRLMRDHQVDAVITKDSGGQYTVAKLEAATDLGIPVVVVLRPPPEPGVREAATVAEALGWLQATESAQA